MIEGFRAALPGAGIYVYDNNSTDGTAEVATAAGAVLAAEALYAGFAEEVYLDSWLLLAWALFRAVGLPAPALRRYAGALGLTALGAAALAAPLLVAFAAYLGQAELGVHADSAPMVDWLDPAGLAQYVLPYLFGTIFGSPEPAVSDLLSGTGGYIGFGPVVLAFAALLDPRRRGAKLVLAGWIVLAVGASHGAPALYTAFRAPPLTGIAAFSRYLDASCDRASRLTRLELAFPGWAATVNGSAAPVATAEGAFQAVDLPAGESVVVFRYAPRGFGPASAAAGLALLWVFAVGSRTLFARRAPRRSTGVASARGVG